MIPVLIIEEGDFAEPWGTIGTVGNWLIWLAIAFESVVMLSVVPGLPV